MGINIFVDETGNDIYDSGLFSQGASALGLSIMLDKQAGTAIVPQGFLRFSVHIWLVERCWILRGPTATKQEENTHTHP
jgi:hypothetical protein